MGADPNLPWLEQAKQHLREAAGDNPRLPQDLIWAIDAIIRHLEGEKLPEPSQCGRRSTATSYTCTRPLGHDGRHGYAGVFWND